MSETPTKPVTPAPVAVVKNDSDPVKIRCAKVSWPKPNPLAPPVDHGPLPEKINFQYGGVAYEVPVGGEMKVTMPRVGADFIIGRAKRYWTLQAELSILEPTFK